MIILGFNCFGHDSAATIVVDGEVVCAVEEERLNRKKHDGGFPVNAIRTCLDHAGVKLGDVDHVGFAWNPWISYRKIPVFLVKYWDKVPSLMKEQRHFTVEENLGMLNYLGDMRRLGKHLREAFPGEGFKAKVHLLEHHLCHAASAYYPSGYDRSAILTIDGAGEWDTGVMAIGTGNKIRKISAVRTPHSLGAFYQAISRYLGFKLITGPGKLMGLASYGDGNSAEYDKMKHLIHLKTDGSFELDMRYFCYHYTRKSGVTEVFENLFGPSRTEPGNWSDHELNVAAAAQHIVEDVFLHMASYLKKQTASENLCMAGGVTLNSVGNGLLVKSGLFKNIFIQPAAGDSGSSMGACLLLNHHYLGRERNYVMDTAFLGPGYSDASCEEEIKKAALPYVKQDDFISFAAQQLADGKILGWHQGRLEFGPRALGNRSILATATRADMKDILNARVKFREGFRPFAAIVLEEDCGTYFDCDYPSPYMLKVYGVKEDYRDKLPSITHADHSVRIQTVTKKENPRMWALISAFKECTGYGCLINTSFNVRGEPIVCTPFDAVDSFIRADMDFLVAGNCIAAKPGNEAVLPR